MLSVIYDNNIILPYELLLFRSASVYVDRIVANIIRVFSHYHRCPSSGRTLISRFALNHLSTLRRSSSLSLSSPPPPPPSSSSSSNCISRFVFSLSNIIASRFSLPHDYYTLYPAGFIRTLVRQYSHPRII